MRHDKIRKNLMDHGDDRSKHVIAFHDHHLPEMLTATGSSGNHHFWQGGYYDHISDCFSLAHRMWMTLSHRTSEFGLCNIFYVLYFHDIEKLWKYGNIESELKCPPNDVGKEVFYMEELPSCWNIWFTDDELNALKYIHGEGQDYSKTQRIMCQLAGFCHAVDILSARTWPEMKML